MTPLEIVKKLDKYIIGQQDAKKCVAIALRNRWRRQQVPEDLREEIMPNNIILIGPTGVGKTELARRLAKLDNSPFIKVEASKFTEVGYVGRDVESIIRDLVDLAVNVVRGEFTDKIREKADEMAQETLVNIIQMSMYPEEDDIKVETDGEILRIERDKVRQQLIDGDLDEELVELEVQSDFSPLMQIISPMGVEDMGMSIQDIMGPMMPAKMKKRKMRVPEALVYLQLEEVDKLIDMDEVIREGIRRVEETGIVFLDEIDKIADENDNGGPDVSREGVQRDLLPVIEGTNVITKYGMVCTDHILFIASGAFHVSKPSDLIPELQGRFPIRVELDSLTAVDFERILTEPENALIKQYTALMATENVKLNFTGGAIKEIARIADQVNQQAENIGARRLHTIMSLLLEDILFDVPTKKIESVTIDKKMVMKKLEQVIGDDDLSQYIYKDNCHEKRLVDHYRF